MPLQQKIIQSTEIEQEGSSQLSESQLIPVTSTQATCSSSLKFLLHHTAFCFPKTIPTLPTKEIQQYKTWPLLQIWRKAGNIQNNLLPGSGNL